MKKPFALVSLVISLLIAAPALAADENPVDPRITDGTAAREFKQAREKWLNSEIRSYRMTVHSSCFCVGPQKAKVTVRRGKVVRISATPWYGPRTVPGMFKVIGQAIKSKATMLNVTYAGRLGFPKKTSIDYVAMMADEERAYRITGFKQL